MRRGLRAALRLAAKEVEAAEAVLDAKLEQRATLIREADAEGEGHVEIGKLVKLTRGRVWQICNRGDSR
jgi:hypothetical protein